MSTRVGRLFKAQDRYRDRHCLICNKLLYYRTKNEYCKEHLNLKRLKGGIKENGRKSK